MADVRLALRMLVQRPAFALFAILTLAIGIGANSAIFSVINGVLLRPLPYPTPDRIVQMNEHTAKRVSRVSRPNVLDWRQQSTSFTAMAFYSCYAQTVSGGNEALFVPTCVVSRDFFPVLDVSPEIGRSFTAEESQVNGTPAVVVSRRFWQKMLASNPDLSQLHLRVGDKNARVVGVMADGLGFPDTADLWIPAELDADTSGRTAHNWDVIGRLKPGIPVASAQAEMNTIAAQLKAHYGNDENAVGVVMVPLQDAMTASSKNRLFLLLGIVALVLLIACANVAATMLARGEERRTEMAIRAALGAAPGRLVRQLLVESTVLGLLGATGGLLLAAWMIRALLSFTGVVIPRHQAIGLDWRVMAFTLLLGLLTPLLFGLVPSLHASRADLRSSLAEGGRGAAPARAWVRSALVTIEIAVALLLLTGSALLMRSFAKVMAVDPGFDTRGVVAATVAVPATKYPSPVQAAQFYQRALERVRAIPGVSAAGAVTDMPLGQFDPDGAFRFEGHPDVGAISDGRYDGYKYSAAYHPATPGYFAAIGAKLKEGRALEDRDVAGQPPVAVVNETFVKRFLPHTDPIGVRFAYGGMDPVNPMFTIVGVVGDMRQDSLLLPATPQVFVSLFQQPYRAVWQVTVVARAADPNRVSPLVASLRDGLRADEPDVPADITTFDQLVRDSVADRRFLLLVLGTFALIALLLAGTGIYGVLSQSVAQRTQEIGIRMALGAEPGTVVLVMIASALRAVAAGVVVGAVGVVLAARLIRSFLFDVTPADPLALAMAAGVLTIVAIIAGFVPARRATHVDPLVALRN